MLKKLAQQTVIYGLGTILSRLVNYLIVPIHTSYFEEEADYGIITIFYAYAVFLNVLYTYGMETAYFRHANKEDINPQQLYDTALMSLIGSSLVFSGLIAWQAQKLAAVAKFPDMWLFVVWFAVILASDAISVVPFARLRQEGKAVLFVAIRLANILLNVGLTWFFLVACASAFAGDWGESARQWAAAFFHPQYALHYAFGSNMVASLLTLLLLSPWLLQLRFRFSWPLYRHLLMYGSPLIIAGLAFGINESGDKLILTYWLPPDLYPNLTNKAVVGIYGAAYKLSIFITLAVQAYKFAAEPFFFGKMKEENPKPFYALSLDWFVIATAGMFVVVSTNRWWIADLFIRNKDFHVALDVVPVLLMANVCLGMYYNLAIWFKVSDRTQFGAWIGLAGAGITILANLTMIPYLGYMGCAFATLLCYGSMAVLTFLLGQKYYPISYPLGKILLSLGISVALVMVYELFKSNQAEFGIRLWFSILIILPYAAYVGLRAWQAGWLARQ